MFYVEWDPSGNGVILRLEKTEHALNTTPRPVFHEELDMLGMGQYWQYPHTQKPLCWACGRKYYANGVCVMETRGGDMYTPPEIIVPKAGKELKLFPIDIDAIYAKNAKLLLYLEYEAMQFIYESFIKYGNKLEITPPVRDEVNWEKLREIQEAVENIPMAVVQQSCGSFDIVPMEEAHASEKNVVSGSKVEETIVSFSAGKDSQVVLDLATRVLAPSSYSVVYGDTGYELPSSLRLFNETIGFYREKFHNIKFDLTKNQQPIMYYWEKMGPPSRMHRWCCAVMKTAPLYRYLKIKAGRDKQPKVLVFEGVRAEESARRSEYLRTGSSVKHRGVINARPIFRWNNTEVYLYLLHRDLPLNKAYRQGLSRVGCALCPYSSGWSEYIVMKTFPKVMAPFVRHLEKRCRDMNVPDIDVYIKDGMWKMRGGSKSLLKRTSGIDVLQADKDLILLLTNPQENFFEWLKVIGPYTQQCDGDVVRGEIHRKIGKNELIQQYILEKLSKDTRKITFPGLPSHPDLQSLLLKVINKITYCVHCEACEVECPTGALTVTPKVTIDSKKCIHCTRCVQFKDKGCMMAKSLAENIFNTSRHKKMNPDRYNTFGLQQEWLVDYMAQLDTFFTSNHGLNPAKQVPALKNWLREAGLLNTNDTTPTQLARIINENKIFPSRQNILWEIIWANLAVHSTICQIFINILPVGTRISKKDLIAMVIQEGGLQSERSAENAVNSLINLINKGYFKNMRMFDIEMKGRMVISIMRLPYTPSPESFAYSIFAFSKRHGSNFLTVTELLSNSHIDSYSKLFGLTAESIEPLVRLLQNKYSVADVQLSMGLDNVILDKNLAADEVLTITLQKS